MTNKITELKDKIISIMSMNATPKKIAIGVAVAMFWNFIPSLGIGPVLTFLATKILRGHIVAGLTLNLGTSIFIPLFYTLNFITGRAVTGASINSEAKNPAKSDYLQFDTLSFDRVKNFFESPETIFEALQGFSQDFLIGSVINAFVVGIFLYVVFYLLLKRREARIFEKS